MNDVITSDIREFLKIADQYVTQKIENGVAYITSENIGILSNVAEILSYCGFIVRYNDSMAQTIEVELA